MCSVRNKIHQIESLIDDKPSIEAFCISETWITRSKLDLLKVEDYNLASSYCRSTHEGGGVCIFLKHTIDYIELADIRKLSIECIFETCAIEIRNPNLILIVVYWPNNSRKPDIFFEQLDNLLQLVNIKYSKKKVIIGGDLNIDVLKTTALSQKLLNLFGNANFHQNVREHTRITPNSQTCLDILFTNFDMNNTEIEVVELGFSDHRGVLVTLQSISDKTKAQRIQYSYVTRLYTENNINKFKTELQNTDFTSLFNPQSTINENFDRFHAEIKNLLDQCIPKKRFKPKPKPKRQWLTRGLKVSSEHKRQLKILINQGGDTVLKKHFKTYDKILKRAVYISKKINNINKINNSKNKVKTVWQIIGEQTNKAKIKKKDNMSLNINGSIINDPQLVTNTFNSFFASVGSIAANSIPRGRPVITQTTNTIFLSPVHPCETFKCIKHLKNKNSYGIDEIPPSLVKLCATELTNPLTDLINQSFSSGIFPESLKISLIKPVHKKGDHSDTQNYRPIALLNTFSKIFESIMANRLTSFCNKFNVFDERQYGFRKQRSTTLTVYKFVQEALTLIDNKKYAFGLLLDMSKAYDRVRHDILINKLYGVGIRGTAYKWFKSYLRNRQQIVEIEFYNDNTKTLSKVRSSTIITTCSIPQGSVLGCILFILYINDLPKLLDTINIKSLLYADDISIIFPSTNPVEVTNTIDTIFNTVLPWLEEHNLIINLKKTNLVQIRPHQRLALQINYSYQSQNLELASTCTLLGFSIDENLNWKAHIEKTSAKLSRFAYALKQILLNTNLKTAVSAYHAFAQSWLQYGIILWGNSVNINDLFILQKRCIRVLAKITTEESCRPHFAKLNILTLTSLYILETCKFVRKYENLFKNQNPKPQLHNLRNRNKLVQAIPANLQMFSKGPYSMSIRIYNQIPQYIKNETKYNNFVNKLKCYLITECPYNVREFMENWNKK
jgi:hypothetical protein